MEKEDLKNNTEEDTVEVEVTGDAGAAEPVAEQDEATLLKQRLEEQKNDYLRLAAEFDNFRKRTRRDTADIIRSANESLIIQLLDVLDNFERAMKSREEGIDFETYSKGVALVYEKLNAILGNAGLKRFNSLGEPFDPRFHEALLQVEADDKEPDTVANELSPGYTLNDKVIRHAKVGVTKKKEEN